MYIYIIHIYIYIICVCVYIYIYIYIYSFHGRNWKSSKDWTSLKVCVDAWSLHISALHALLSDSSEECKQVAAIAHILLAYNNTTHTHPPNSVADSEIEYPVLKSDIVESYLLVSASLGLAPFHITIYYTTKKKREYRWNPALLIQL